MKKTSRSISAKQRTKPKKTAKAPQLTVAPIDVVGIVNENSALKSRLSATDKELSSLKEQFANTRSKLLRLESERTAIADRVYEAAVAMCANDDAMTQIIREATEDRAAEEIKAIIRSPRFEHVVGQYISSAIAPYVQSAVNEKYLAKLLETHDDGIANVVSSEIRAIIKSRIGCNAVRMKIESVVDKQLTSTDVLRLIAGVANKELGGRG